MSVQKVDETDTNACVGIEKLLLSLKGTGKNYDIDKINKEDLYATDDTTYNILKRICWVPFINGIFSLGILVLDVLLLFATIVWFIYKKFKSLKIKFKINLPIKNKLISSYIIKCNELYKKIVEYIMKLTIA